MGDSPTDDRAVAHYMGSCGYACLYPALTRRALCCRPLPRALTLSGRALALSGRVLTFKLKSPRDGSAGCGDAYPVVCEFEVHAGELDFGHVAGGAAARGDGACRGGTLARLRLFGGREVAGRAFRVVEGFVAFERAVRVVAGRAAHALVVEQVRAAVEDAVGLEAYVC